MTALKRIVIMVFAVLMPLTAYAEELPVAYRQTEISNKIGDTIVLSDTLEVTVTGSNLTTYSGSEGATDHIIIVDLDVRNIGSEAINGGEVLAGLMPIVYLHPLNIEEENDEQYDGWYNWEEMVDSLAKDSRFESNLETCEIYVETDTGDIVNLKDADIPGGGSLGIKDVRGSVNREMLYKRGYFPIGYRVSFRGDVADILIHEYEMDFNDPDAYDEAFGQAVHSFMFNVYATWDREAVMEYYQRCDNLEGAELYKEETYILQNYFGLEETGVFNQELLNHINHHRNINE